MALLDEVRTTWTGVAGSPYYTTIRHENTHAIDLNAFIGAWGVLVNALRPNFDDSVVAVSDPEIRIIESTSGETVGVTTHASGTWAGTNAGEMLPPSNQLLIQWHTPSFIGGHRVRGRTFLPAQSEGNNGSQGTPSAGYTSSVQTLLNTFLTSVGSSFVIYSPTHKVYAAVTSATVWNQWAVLRSRRD